MREDAGRTMQENYLINVVFFGSASWVFMAALCGNWALRRRRNRMAGVLLSLIGSPLLVWLWLTFVKRRPVPDKDGIIDVDYKVLD